MDDAPRLGTLPILIGVELRRDPAGLSCSELARRLRRRKADVLQVLEHEPWRFESSGGTCGRRWTSRERTSRPPGPLGDPRHVPAAERLRAA